MGKIRNARRNPSVTVTELRETYTGDEVTHRGDTLTVRSSHRSNGGITTWLLLSETGVEYEAVADYNGYVSVGITGRYFPYGS